MPELTQIVVDPLHALLLVVVGIAAGFVNTLAGGGSLVMVPALMLLGLPAGVANGSSRVAVLAQSATGVYSFARAGRLSWPDALDVVPAAVVGAIAGAYVATILPNRVFQPLLIGTMLAMAFALFLRPETLAPASATEPRRAARRPLALLALLVAGFYGGLLQAGVGLVLIALLGGMLRYDLVRGNALKGLVVAVYTVPALAVFIVGGKVAWIPALVLAAGNVVGAHLGVRFAVRRGQDGVRKLVVVVVLAACVYLLVR